MRLKLPLLGLALLAVPAAVLAQDTKEAIEAGSQAWEAGWNAGDAAAIAAVYMDDAVVLAPGAEPVKGRQAIHAFWQSQLDQRPGVISTIETLEVHELGDAVVEVGSYVDTGSGGEHLDHGKFIAVWMKTDSGWKIARDIFNSSMMP